MAAHQEQRWRSLITCHVMTIVFGSVDTVVTFSGFMSGSVFKRVYSLVFEIYFGVVFFSLL